MNPRLQSCVYAMGLVVLGLSCSAHGAEAQTALVPVLCSSAEGERQHCAATTSAGVLMARSTGTAACLLGKTWGYDDAGVWVLDGCGGEFLVAQATPPVPVPGETVAATQQPEGPTTVPASAASSTTATDQEQSIEQMSVNAAPRATVATAREQAKEQTPVTATPTAIASKSPKKLQEKTPVTAAPTATASTAPEQAKEQTPVTAAPAATASTAQEQPAATAAKTASPLWGTFNPGNGFLIGRSELGELSISGYAMVRYMNQMPASDTFTDHLGNEHIFDGREDFYSHRVLVWLKGWLGDPKLLYNIAFWTVNTTDQDALFGNIGYQFDKKFNLYAGINGNPGTRSMQGSHPYWLGHDRVMADEFFRPFFSQGIWANGELFPGFWYNAMAGNNSSILGTKAVDLDREFTTGASVWWMPTTYEFGPRGGYGDFEYHDELATRFGISTTWSTEQRYNDEPDDPRNTSLKLADSLNLFGTGSLAPDVTVTEADYQIMSVDAGLKYKGFFLQGEYYMRKLDNFVADGFLPVDEIKDHGFYVQTAFFPIPKKLELYAATSQIFGDKDAGFDDSSEYLIGMNYYPWNTRNHRLNLQIGDVNGSPVGSTFGYYTAGQTGTTVSTAFSVFF